MSILLVNLIICMLIAFLFKSDKKASRHASLFIFFCIFILHSFADIGSLEDLTAYSLGFDEIRRMTMWQCLTTDVEVCKMERGFSLLLKLFSLAGLGLRSFLIFNALFTSVLFYKTIAKYSPSVLLSSLLFLVIINNQSLYVIRQYLVVAIFFYSIRWVIERKLLNYLIMCAICFFIHQSSIILIPIYFLYKLDAKHLVLFTILSALLLRFALQIVINYFTSTLVGYSTYVFDDYSDGQNIIGFYISIVYLLIFVLVLRKNVFQEGINKLLLIASILNCILLFFGVGLNFAARLSIYFSALYIILVPVILIYLRTNYFRICVVAGSLALNTLMTFYGSVSIEAMNYRFMSIF